MAKFFKNVEPLPLNNKRQALLDTPLAVTTPPKPIIALDARYCKVNNNATALRNLFLIPWFIGLCYTFYVHVDELMTGWRGAEQSAKRYIESTKIMYGDNFFENTQDPYQIKAYNLINEQGMMTFRTYLHHNYNDYVGGDRRLRIDIFLVALYSIGLPGLLIWIIRFRRRPPLYFDRERQLLYTWHRGHVRGQRYDKLRLHENIQALIFVLRGQHKDGSLGWTKFLVQPTGNPLLSSVSSYQTLLAFLAQYMAYGKDHVLPDQQDFNARRAFYFYEDKQPADLEQQLEQLLQALDHTDDEPPLDGNGIPIANAK